MISYHLSKSHSPWDYASGFKTADTNDVMRLSRALSGFVWSPCIWQRGIRREDHFLQADWCVLDFDSGEMTLAQACNVFCDTIHIIGKTKSHGKDKGGVICDRFRVAIKFEYPLISLRDYRYTMSRVVRRHPVDGQPKDGARFFFPCTEIVSLSSEGYTEDCLKAPEGFERPNHARNAVYQRTGVLPSKLRHLLTMTIPTGSRNTTWYGFAKDMARIGYTEEDVLILIAKSATYLGQVPPDLVRELEHCVSSGFKAVAKETDADGRNEAHECYQN